MDTAILQNRLLTVTINDENGLKKRFVRMGTVGQVQLAGGPAFCAREYADTTPGGYGLAEEFGIDEPIGYDEAGENGVFLKPGVGWLKKSGGTPYHFATDYRLESPGHLEVRSGSDWREAVWESAQGNGYDCRLKKSYRLEGDRLITENTFVNCGSRPFAVTEYCHNFLSIGGIRFPEGYRLSWLHGTGAEQADSLLQFSSYPGYLSFSGEECAGVTGFALSCGQWEVDETVDFEVIKTAIWAMPHVVSVELFKRISLEPGKEAHWSRIHRFYGKQ
ncbi:MAG TPA: hypothetical protein DCL73_08055 [Treponema sp.]|nr:hypothetical protein [Treponema sp.]